MSSSAFQRNETDNGERKRDAPFHYREPASYRDLSGFRAVVIEGRPQSIPESILHQRNVSTTIAALIGWKIASVGDADGDGKADLVWRHETGGQNRLWLMNYALIRSTTALAQEPDLNWRIVGAGDLNGDNTSDLIWRHSTTGQNKVWLLEGANVTSRPINSEPVDWSIAGVGDLDGDGHEDLFWHHSGSGGANKVWTMSGSVRLGTPNIPSTGDPNWQIASPH